MRVARSPCVVLEIMAFAGTPIEPKPAAAIPAKNQRRLVRSIERRADDIELCPFNVTSPVMG
jgi:hypothetical protein